MIDQYLKGALLLGSPEIRKQHEDLKNLIKKSSRLVFLGNGGSFQGHIAHDYLKVGKIKTLSIDSPSLLTCLFNDYPKEEAYLNWFKVQRQDGDLVIAVSSSGESLNIVNAARYAKMCGYKVVTLTGFKQNNALSLVGDINIWFDTDSYGVHECYSQILLHSILDDLVKEG